MLAAAARGVLADESPPSPARSPILMHDVAALGLAHTDVLGVRGDIIGVYEKLAPGRSRTGDGILAAGA